MSISEAAGTRQLNLGQPEPAAAPCGAYAWCAETGDHSMHLTAYVEAPTLDGYGDCVLPANVMAEDGPDGIDISVGFLDLNLTAEQTRARVTELHRHLDTVAALADIVDGRAPLEPGTETYSVTATGASGALISAEVYHLDDPQPGEPAARIAVFGQPGTDADLDVAGADQLAADLEQFLPRLRAQRNHLAAILQGAEPEAPRPIATPGHYPWCNLAACITHQYDEHEGGGSYIEHAGRDTAVTLSDGHLADDIRITAGLGADESYSSGPKVYLAVGDLDVLGLDANGVDSTITQLEALTSALRTMRGQMDSEARA
ncbi:DUF6907 domain-containing protein [Streptomyces anulatus]|uniref:DUF6907 domain-containing protein n=1 Tax=Streptomyces TaxID=1883 RepID=UPI000939DE03|nr:hypothetical protein [Streptomyces sp. TSRI0395]OKI83794.1 hypothetical protein AMK12_11775 [Streptomyces sp. TSRI0395]